MGGLFGSLANPSPRKRYVSVLSWHDGVCWSLICPLAGLAVCHSLAVLNSGQGGGGVRFAIFRNFPQLHNFSQFPAKCCIFFSQFICLKGYKSILGHLCRSVAP